MTIIKIIIFHSLMMNVFSQTSLKISNDEYIDDKNYSDEIPERIMSIDDVFTSPIYNTTETEILKKDIRRNFSFFLHSIGNENSIDRKGVLLDLFLNENYLSAAQTRTLLLLIVVGITAVSLLMFVFCFISLVGKKPKSNKRDSVSTIKTFDFHKGGGGI